MKIVIIGSKDFDSLEFHINDSFTFLGHHTFQIDIKDVMNIPHQYNYIAQKYLKKYDRYIFDRIAKKTIEQKPDLVIACYRFIHPECIKLIKSSLKSVKIVHLNPDALTTFERQQIFVSPYDAYFTKDPFIKRFMKDKMGLNAFYLPEAFNERIHTLDFKDRSKLEKEIDIDVVCFGTMYPYRSKMIENIVNQGINIDIFGTQESRFPIKKLDENLQLEYITGKRKAKILIGSKIVFNNFHYAEVESVNAKFFEIAGMGGFQICDYKPAIDEYSGISPDKFTYNSIGEACELIKYYLTKPDERHRLVELQKEHFLENHTYDKRMNELLSLLEL